MQRLDLISLEGTLKIKNFNSAKPMDIKLYKKC